MKKFIILILSLQFGFIFSQENQLEKAANKAKQYIAQGNELLVDQGNFSKAEGEYRKAIATYPENPTAKYNLANAYYGSEKYDEATLRYKEATKVADATKSEKHRAFHNQGNTFMEQKKYKEAIEAYKNALRNNPKDDETRYNLALAKKMLEQQEQQNDQNQDQKDQNQDQDQKEDQKEDQKDQKEGDDKEEKKGDDGENKDDQKDKGDQDNKEKDQGEDQKDEDGEPKDDQKDKGDQGEQDKNEQGEPKEQQPQRPQGQLSPQQVKSLLEAMNNEEKKVQDKINAKKTQGSKVKTEKDW
ncbi:tetratricopeptide repeat protein [Aquimarina sp. U1-2]|uniref:tetratricopeptide repeat protein n=1 Tax=Aquimarina sp. U1-2 TaxID=2823141 RepID=UPI001AECA36F|nr:tetratricopeptide repeat protein [Aquimarina sp. U1-2]MBP2833344.1 tetratricopeptide repeat protein [Aquimarina sp. U1-2]